MLQPRIVTKYVTPPEAGGIAQQYREAADRVRNLSRRIKNSGDNLEVQWTGKARNRFLSRFDSTPADIERYAQLLDQIASDIASIKVMVEEVEWVDV